MLYCQDGSRSIPQVIFSDTAHQPAYEVSPGSSTFWWPSSECAFRIRRPSPQSCVLGRVHTDARPQLQVRGLAGHSVAGQLGGHGHRVPVQSS